MPADVISQSELTTEKNIRFLLDNIASYRESVRKLDTSANVPRKMNEAAAGIDRRLEIGNGGVFDYDTSLVRQTVALDLSFGEIRGDAKEGIPGQRAAAHGKCTGDSGNRCVL